jgi:hypothetical protein
MQLNLWTGVTIAPIFCAVNCYQALAVVRASVLQVLLSLLTQIVF